jgi:probable phosphoglycerate mutase
VPDRTWQVFLVRHGETEWSRGGRHTGRSDIPLTEQGREDARRLAAALAGRPFVRVLCSPLQRARDTCALAGCADGAELRPELMEWDYGEYEGLTFREIQARRPGWAIWRDGCPGGEVPGDVGARVDPVVAELQQAQGDAVVFAHGHLLRVLAARWLAEPPAFGSRLGLGTAAVCALGFEHDLPLVRRWNDTAHLPPERRAG